MYLSHSLAPALSNRDILHVLNFIAQPEVKPDMFCGLDHDSQKQLHPAKVPVGILNDLLKGIPIKTI